tara:strand:+ start:38 stop:832 length:795 start_codon:yes stop_codon:yes gene_type:complete
MYNIKNNYKQISLPYIESIVESDNIVSNCNEKVTDWYFKNRKDMTWNKFMKLKDIDDNIKTFIIDNFDKNKDFSSHILSLNNYYEYFILNNKKWIKQLYKKFLKCKNIHQITEILFYLMVIMHGLKTQHYFHIKAKGNEYNHLLDDYSDLFDEIKDYVNTTKRRFVMSSEIITKWGLVGKIDQIDNKNEIWSVKCTKEIPLKAVIKSLCLSMFLNEKITEDFKFRKRVINCNYINFLTGNEISYKFNISSGDVKNIINILSKKN